jgi:hypothetical protein
MSIDIQKLKIEIKRTEAELRALKALFRESGQPRVVRTHWVAEEKRYDGTGRRFARARGEATLLYMLRASLRGRLHRRTLTLEEQAGAVLELRSRFDAPAVPTST